MSKSFWAQRNAGGKRNDLLCKKWTDDKGTSLQVIILLQGRRKVIVLFYMYNHKTARRLGVREILNRVKQKF